MNEVRVISGEKAAGIRRHQVRKLLIDAADIVHDATEWSQRNEFMEPGKTIMDQVVEEIERIYSEPVTVGEKRG